MPEIVAEAPLHSTGDPISPGHLNDLSVPHWYMYPPKALFTRAYDDIDFRRALFDVDGSISLYIHIPFCRMRCSFCTLLTDAKSPASEIDDYLLLIRRHARLISQSFNVNKQPRVSTVYVGGGTPSILDQCQIAQLMTSVTDHFH